jgi:hypothetical protein
VVSNINGGRKNGGYTLRLRRGTHHLERRAGARAGPHAQERVQHAPERPQPRGAPAEDPVRHQVALLSPTTFFRLPWVSWQAPKAIRSDMAGPALLGLFGSIATSSSPQPRVLPGVPDGSGLSVPENVKQREVRRFLKG